MFASTIQYKQVNLQFTKVSIQKETQPQNHTQFRLMSQPNNLISKIEILMSFVLVSLTSKDTEKYAAYKGSAAVIVRF